MPDGGYVKRPAWRGSVKRRIMSNCVSCVQFRVAFSYFEWLQSENSNPDDSMRSEKKSELAAEEGQGCTRSVRSVSRGFGYLDVGVNSKVFTHIWTEWSPGERLSGRASFASSILT